MVATLWYHPLEAEWQAAMKGAFCIADLLQLSLTDDSVNMTMQGESCRVS